MSALASSAFQLVDVHDASLRWVCVSSGPQTAARPGAGSVVHDQDAALAGAGDGVSRTPAGVRVTHHAIDVPGGSNAGQVGSWTGRLVTIAAATGVGSFDEVGLEPGIGDDTTGPEDSDLRHGVEKWMKTTLSSGT